MASLLRLVPIVVVDIADFVGVTIVCLEEPVHLTVPLVDNIELANHLWKRRERVVESGYPIVELFLELFSDMGVLRIVD
ncbi:hypothetical protein [Haloferax sp. Atlit-4N]|uniref:hypothetical protein n=1 Tax=Haloferax sp. Atlit-4N TaxID=2077206 RepID=UPI0011C06D68|nr:hypothetical protein [Haloferax sp. Atlit-4N]